MEGRARAATMGRSQAGAVRGGTTRSLVKIEVRAHPMMGGVSKRRCPKGEVRPIKGRGQAWVHSGPELAPVGVKDEVRPTMLWEGFPWKKCPRDLAKNKQKWLALN